METTSTPTITELDLPLDWRTLEQIDAETLAAWREASQPAVSAHAHLGESDEATADAYCAAEREIRALGVDETITRRLIIAMSALCQWADAGALCDATVWIEHELRHYDAYRELYDLELQ